MNDVRTKAKANADFIAFARETDWARWLAANHANSTGVWLRFFKNADGTPSVSHDEALAIAPNASQCQ